MAATSLSAYHVERIDGAEYQKPLPKHLHSRIQRWLSRFFASNLPAFLEDWPEQNVICGQDRLIPDIVVCAHDAVFYNGELLTPPVLAVEILSPGQTMPDLFDKAYRLCRAGTPICWLIWPEERRAWTYSIATGAVEQTATLLMSDDTLLVRLPELWQALPH